MNAFVCNTPVQIMRTLQLKTMMREFSGSADIFLMDSFTGAEVVAEHLKELKLFDHIFMLNQREMLATKLFCLMYGKRWAQYFKINKYQKLVSFNVTSKQTEVLFNLNKHNKGFEYHCIEDSPTAYLIPQYPAYPFWHPYRIFGLQHCYNCITAWWSSCPELISVPDSYHTTKVKLPPIDTTNSSLVDLINKAFGYQEDEKLNHADLLIMDESHYQDGLMIDNADYRLYMKIKNRYPEANIIVKMHPRTQHNRYENDFPILNNNYIPWEVYVMNRAQKETKELVQISIACGTMVSDKLLLDYEGSKIYMAPIFYDKIRHGRDGAPRACPETTEKTMEIKKTYHNPDQFQIVSSEEELFRVLDEKLAST